MEDKKKILMTHLYYGDPSVEFSLNLAKTLLDSGADVLEIGIPYTDPICDGEIFQRACRRALRNGITPLKVLEGIRKLRKMGYREPIYLTSYYGPIFKMGVEYFIKLAKEAEITGLIIPDFLLEEQKELRKPISLIQFATVYSTEERLEKLLAATNDFIYCIALPGVTGDKQNDRLRLKNLIRRIKSISDKKVFVGFGIRSGNDVREILSFGVDGVIVGSAIAKIYEKEIKNPEISLCQISAFIKNLKQSTIR